MYRAKSEPTPGACRFSSTKSTPAGIEDHVGNMRADPAWPPGPCHLLDTTTATAVTNIANTKLVEVAAEAAATNRRRYVVVVHRFAETAATRCARSK
jgi:hypothetical protein